VISAVEQVQDLIGRPVESVTGMEKNGNEWTVTLEVLELQRVPNTTDVLGKYEVTVNKDGELTGTQRTRRYPRAEAGEV
jgi:Gas vesicle synthesis protein GvpO